MKSFIAAIILFFTTVGCVVLNSFYVNRSLAEISKISEEISSSDHQESAVDELIQYWSNTKSMLGFSIKETKLERIGELVEAIRFAVQSNNYQEAKHFCTLMQELCKETQNYERISLQSIF